LEINKLMVLEQLFKLENKTALITGASSGIGKHSALLLAQAGARVAVASRRISQLETTVREIEDLGGQAKAFELDVTNKKSVVRCFDQILEWSLPSIIINNAGVCSTGKLLDHTEEDWDRVMDTNLKGSWLVATEAARRLIAANSSGSIVNIASILGERVIGGAAPYVISKAGVIQSTKVMALELARHQIRVNALLPGYVITDLNREFLLSDAGQKILPRIPSRRFNKLDDLNGPLLLLASDASKAMSGSTIAVDGGHLVSGL
jgi:NAD(P)-dependent dehydrogenase (short-subunit alcohol dehydrogenase family)